MKKVRMSNEQFFGALRGVPAEGGSGRPPKALKRGGSKTGQISYRILKKDNDNKKVSA